MTPTKLALLLLRIALIAAFGLTYAACVKPGEDDGAEICKKAREHAEECMLEGELLAEVECTERQECTAACVAAASCSELATPKPDGDYIACLSECAEKAEAGTRPCEEALERFETCGIDTTGVSVPDCSGSELCVANCVNDATCSEIRREEENNAEYLNCLDAC